MTPSAPFSGGLLMAAPVSDWKKASGRLFLRLLPYEDPQGITRPFGDLFLSLRILPADPRSLSRPVTPAMAYEWQTEEEPAEEETAEAEPEETEPIESEPEPVETEPLETEPEEPESIELEPEEETEEPEPIEIEPEGPGSDIQLPEIPI